MELATLDTAADLEPTASHNRGAQSDSRLDAGAALRARRQLSWAKAPS